MTLRRDEADILALRLVVDGQTRPLRDPPHLVLGVPGQGEEHPCQRLPRHRVEEIGLVLPEVLRPLQPVPALFRLDAGVMAGGDAVEPPGQALARSEPNLINRLQATQGLGVLPRQYSPTNGRMTFSSRSAAKSTT